jgi:chorismate dehydratase
VALLDSLLYESTGKIFPLLDTDPEYILSGLDTQTGGLLIGDSALQFEKEYLFNKKTNRYRVIDLSAWWNQIHNLPFVFALWAYPSASEISPDFFTESLNSGLENIQEIINESEFPDTENYLTLNLHYYLADEDRKAISVFRNLLHILDTKRKDQKHHSFS